jgi:hypothetical protein
MQSKLIFLFIISLLFSACCRLKSIEVAKYRLTQSELNLLPYTKGEKISFVHSNGYEFDFTVSEESTIFREDYLTENDCPRFCNSIQERSVTLNSSYPVLSFHFYICSKLPVDSLSTGYNSSSTNSMKINFNSHYDLTVKYDSLANFICNDSLTTCYDSILINGNLYNSVIEKQFRNLDDSTLLYPKSILFNKRGLLQLKMSNNETYSIKN